MNIPSRPVGNRGRFSNMSGFSNSTYLTCVNSNWPMSNLRSESERNMILKLYKDHCKLSSLSPAPSKSRNNPYGEPVCRLIIMGLLDLRSPTLSLIHNLIVKQTGVEVWENENCCGDKREWASVSTAFSSSEKLSRVFL